MIPGKVPEFLRVNELSIGRTWRGYCILKIKRIPARESQDSGHQTYICLPYTLSFHIYELGVLLEIGTSYMFLSGTRYIAKHVLTAFLFYLLRVYDVSV